ncbi:MAG: FG-GAP-like repeat-containing protein [Planctomycetes bacterium]|nr:FG-GAP-like repeat-containing protein [Planctomycetota bacterium]
MHLAHRLTSSLATFVFAVAVSLGFSAASSTARAQHVQPFPSSLERSTIESRAASDDWSARVGDGLRRAEYEFRAVPGESHVWSAPNRAQGLRVRVSSDGLEVFPRATAASGVGAEWKARLATRHFGREDLTTVATAPGLSRSAVDHARVELDHGALVEWFENREVGLEHGWTIAVPPAGVGELVIGLEFTGDLSFHVDPGGVDAGGRSATWRDACGVAVLSYRGLAVFDATGRELPARLAPGAFGPEVRIDDSGAAYPLEVDPVIAGPAWSVVGAQANAQLGYGVSGAGDVDGDGFSDVIVGAPYYDAGQSDEGRALLFRGSAAGLATTPAWTVESNQSGASLGFAVAFAGDVDGDGFSDVLVSAPFYDSTTSNVGRVELYRGSPSGLGATPAWSVLGPHADANFGNAVRAAGDVDADGFDDVLVGAPTAAASQFGEGRAYLFRGSASGPATSPSWTLDGGQDSAFLGNSLAGAGDLDGDGYDDVIVGVQGYDTALVDAGRVLCFYGSASGLAATPDVVLDGGQAFANFGYPVAPAGDVDGDGYADLAVGAIHHTNGETQEGRAFVYRGSAAGLATSPAWTAESNQATARFGIGLASAGDVDADGFGDLVVGASYYDDGAVDNGRVYVFLGSPTGLAASPVWIGAGSTASSGVQFGTACAAAGDVDADGYSDVLVGARGFTGSLAGEGGAFVFQGGAQGPSASANWNAQSNQVGARLGASVAGAGDLDGDGFGDVLVGAPYYDGGELDEGRALVYLGSATGLSTSPAWSVESDQAGARLGTCVASAGDVDGNGYGDVLVGAPLWDGGQTDEGSARVYLGSSAGLATSPAWQIESDQSNAFLGQSVASAGDVDGDGFLDVLVGAWGYTNGQSMEGRAQLFRGSPLGPSTTPSWSAEGGSNSAWFGYSVASAGDVDRDGRSDVVVGAYGAERAYLYRGTAVGLETTHSWTATGAQSAALFGRTVASAGDVNGDGFSDVIVAAYQYDNGQSNEGRAFVFHGSASGLLPAAAWTAESDQANAFFGYSLASAGDVDGDGYGDVIVGAVSYNGGFAGEGRAYVYLGSASGLAPSPAWAAESNQPGASFGRSVASAGDVNGDGYADVIVGADLFDLGQADEGHAFVFQGNDGGGAWTRAPRQSGRFNQAPIQLLADARSPLAFRIALDFVGNRVASDLAASATPTARLEWQLEELATPLDGAPVHQGAVQGFGGTSLSFDELVQVPLPNFPAAIARFYHWRARVRTNHPFFPVTPWVSLAGNNVTERKLRASPSSTGK